MGRWNGAQCVCTKYDFFLNKAKYIFKNVTRCKSHSALFLIKLNMLTHKWLKQQKVCCSNLSTDNQSKMLTQHSPHKAVLVWLHSGKARHFCTIIHLSLIRREKRRSEKRFIQPIKLHQMMCRTMTSSTKNSLFLLMYVFNI